MDEKEVLPWLAILGAWLSFGSFAVPIKTQSVIDAQVHPLVYQCNKTFWNFVLSHLVLLFEPYEIDLWWGLASGCSWVPAGVAAIIAVQNVGIAYGQAVWQTTIIATSFTWGFGVLHDEAVYSWYLTAVALACLIVGVVGMTFAFNLQETPVDEASEPGIDRVSQQSTRVEHLGSGATAQVGTKGDPKTPELGAARLYLDQSPCRQSAANSTPDASLQGHNSQNVYSVQAGNSTPVLRNSVASSIFSHSHSSYKLSGIGTSRRRTRSSISDVRFSSDDIETSFLEDSESSKGTSMAIGLSAALFNGIWGGSNLVPSHYASLHGVHFVISFATGALLTNIMLVLLYSILCYCCWKQPLPSPQFRVMAVPGFLSGALWCLGNFFSLYIVSTIGQGIGYSLVQSSVVVSGAWGIFYYSEMAGRPVLYWCLFCCVCLVGVLVLSLERKPVS